MKVTVQFFSRLRDAAGVDQIERDVPVGAAVGVLIETIHREFPMLKQWDAHLLIAVGYEYAAREHILNDGDIISLMPPVQGG